MNESAHIQAINKKVRAAGVYVLKIQTMMNNGVPDCFYSGLKDYLFVEYKYISDKALPKREDTPIKPMLTDLQFDWLINRGNEGRNVAVIIGSNIGWAIYPIWDRPIFKKELNMTRNDVVAWIIQQTSV